METIKAFVTEADILVEAVNTAMAALDSEVNRFSEDAVNLLKTSEPHEMIEFIKSCEAAGFYIAAYSRHVEVPYLTISFGKSLADREGKLFAQFRIENNSLERMFVTVSDEATSFKETFNLKEMHCMYLARFLRDYTN